MTSKTNEIREWLVRMKLEKRFADICDVRDVMRLDALIAVAEAAQRYRDGRFGKSAHERELSLFAALDELNRDD